MKRPRRAFTLIELLIVVVIIGILAAIAIPKFANTKGRAYETAMKSDLKNLSSAMESYFFNNNAYAPSLTELGTNYRSSSGVTVAVGSVTGSGWTGTATHSLSPKTCTVTIGGTATNEGVPVCQ